MWDIMERTWDEWIVMSFFARIMCLLRDICAAFVLYVPLLGYMCLLGEYVLLSCICASSGLYVPHPCCMCLLGAICATSVIYVLPQGYMCHFWAKCAFSGLYVPHPALNVPLLRKYESLPRKICLPLYGMSLFFNNNNGAYIYHLLPNADIG